MRPRVIRRSRGDAGFVLMEALVAAGLLALAGTVILMIGQNALRAQEAELDRSVALVTMATYAKVLGALGAEAGSTMLPAEDEIFRYTVAPPQSQPVDAGASLKYLKLEAHAKTFPELAPLTLELLVPIESAAVP